MKYIKVTKEIYKSPNASSPNSKTGQWESLAPELLYPNLKERFIHTVLGKHFTFGQPYCVVCGRSEDLSIKEGKL